MLRNNWAAVATLDRIFDDVMGSMVGTATNAQTFETTIDVRTNENEVSLVCDVPGVRREDLDITLENRVLTIRGVRRFDGKDGEHVVLGRAYGSFGRAITLPEALDDTTLTAELADGVLTIRIAKHARAKPRRIDIGASPAKQLGRD